MNEGTPFVPNEEKPPNLDADASRHRINKLSPANKKVAALFVHHHAALQFDYAVMSLT
jgi:hypothetical protein